MRVMALGGAGGMGVWACRAAIQSEKVTELTVADLDADRAAQVAAELGPRARGVGLDVTDAAALCGALDEADVVLNTVGPFFRFGVSILRAAINARCDRAERLMPSDFAGTLRPGRLPPLFALATGTHDSRPASVGCALAQVPGTTMGQVTGIPMAAALDLLPGAEPGVHPPESLLDPASYFATLAPHCLKQPKPEEMVAITRSWDPTSKRAIEAALAAARARLNGDGRMLAMSQNGKLLNPR